MAITIEAIINAPIEKVWKYWNAPEHITKWCHASDDWEAPSAENDVRVGGRFTTVMAVKDKSVSFDFGGEYTEVKEHALLSYIMDDGRRVSVVFEQTPEGTKVVETFDPENENPEEMQRSGWQSILDSFKRYAESEA